MFVLECMPLGYGMTWVASPRARKEPEAGCTQRAGGAGGYSLQQAP